VSMCIEPVTVRTAPMKRSFMMMSPDFLLPSRRLENHS
jgi:hypothetical protein